MRQGYCASTPRELIWIKSDRLGHLAGVSRHFTCRHHPFAMPRAWVTSSQIQKRAIGLAHQLAHHALNQPIHSQNLSIIEGGTFGDHDAALVVQHGLLGCRKGLK